MQDVVGVGGGRRSGVGNGKVVCGQCEGWILFIDHNLSRIYVLLLNIPVSVWRWMDGSCNDVTNPIATAPRYLYSERP